MPEDHPFPVVRRQAEEAANFDVSIFKNSRIGRVSHDGEGDPGPKGTVISVSRGERARAVLRRTLPHAPGTTRRLRRRTICSTITYDTGRRGGVGVPTTVRLDPRTESIVQRLARKTGRTKSSIIREAILRMSEHEARPTPGSTLYDRMADLVGVGHGGPSDLASRSEEILRDLFARRRGRR
jgi:hypothetical protein